MVDRGEGEVLSGLEVKPEGGSAEKVLLMGLQPVTI